MSMRSRRPLTLKVALILAGWGTTIITATMMMTMRMDEDRSTPVRQNLLRLLAWLSPAFPTGGFAYSHGLEWAVEAGDVTNETTLSEWLIDLLQWGSGYTDTILLRLAHRSWNDKVALQEVTALALASAAGRERHQEALNQGRAFILAAQPWGVPDDLPDAPYSVSVGATAGFHGIDEDDVAVVYLQAFAANLISAAVRLVPLGQTAGLRVLAGLEPVILHTAHGTRFAEPDDIGGCCFRSDVAALRHETQYTRLFRS
jgi:urease accessory protein